MKLCKGLLTALITTDTTRSSSGPQSPRPRLLEWRRRCRRGVRGPRSPRSPRRRARRCTRATRWSSPPRCPPGNPPSPAPRHPSSGNSQVSSKALPLNIEIVWLCDKTNIFAFLNTLGFRQHSLIEIRLYRCFAANPVYYPLSSLVNASKCAANRAAAKMCSDLGPPGYKLELETNLRRSSIITEKAPGRLRWGLNYLLWVDTCLS